MRDIQSYYTVAFTVSGGLKFGGQLSPIEVPLLRAPPPPLRADVRNLRR
jgi:hypothetical protein